MTWPSALSLDQRQRRDALRDARRLLKRNGNDASPADILKTAEFILGVPDKDQRR